jgi:hypothetical protein
MTPVVIRRTGGPPNRRGRCSLARTRRSSCTAPSSRRPFSTRSYTTRATSLSSAAGIASLPSSSPSSRECAATPRASGRRDEAGARIGRAVGEREHEGGAVGRQPRRGRGAAKVQPIGVEEVPAAHGARDGRGRGRSEVVLVGVVRVDDRRSGVWIAVQRDRDVPHAQLVAILVSMDGAVGREVVAVQLDLGEPQACAAERG